MWPDFDEAGLPAAVTPLLDALRAAAEWPHAPFYAPGHKRGQGSEPRLAHLVGQTVFRADLPELPELDNLFAPQGVIQAAQALAAEAFGADRTFFLANGSTSGILAAMLAVCQPGDRILLPRNLHQSAISGLILSGAVPVFVQPEYDAQRDLAHSITPASVEQALQQHPDIRAVLMVSPTYYGVCGDVAAIAQLAHAHNIPLLVDEAHGAHFAFHPALPLSALAAGADLAVQSTHKTLSALTQAAMLHVQGSRIDCDRIQKALQLVQSTSPSYLLLASLDAARYQMATSGTQWLTQTLERAERARLHIGAVPGLAVLGPEAAQTPGFVDLDRTRLTVTVTGLGLDGFTADTIMHDQMGVTAEYPSLRHLTFIVSIGNTEADIAQLIQACERLAQARAKLTPPLLPTPAAQPLSVPPLALPPREAFFAPTERVPLAAAVGRICAETICPYPPGIPALIPGERITAAATDFLQAVLALGGLISGAADATLQSLTVVKDKDVTT